MEHVHYLHSQHYHDTSARFAKGGCYSKFQFFTTIDHVLQHVVYRVLMHAGAFSNNLSHFASHPAQKTCGALFWLVSRIVTEDAIEIAIVNCGPLEVVSFAFATVVFAQCSLERREWFDFGARSVFRFRAGEARHQLVDVFELVQRGPAAITPTPLRTRREPDGESLGEVFGRVRLRVPRRKMQHELAAPGLGFVEVRIWLREGAEEFAIVALEVKPESRVERDRKSTRLN